MSSRHLSFSGGLFPIAIIGSLSSVACSISKLIGEVRIIFTMAMATFDTNHVG